MRLFYISLSMTINFCSFAKSDCPQYELKNVVCTYSDGEKLNIGDVKFSGNTESSYDGDLIETYPNVEFVDSLKINSYCKDGKLYTVQNLGLQQAITVIEFKDGKIKEAGQVFDYECLDLWCSEGRHTSKVIDFEGFCIGSRP
ncbi:MAG: hypothetical protein H6622_02340 [Halobacteriovoraceae bacterium]|nr:hypothetical protein [Halobacteriovoraceae bacterium]